MMLDELFTAIGKLLIALACILVFLYGLLVIFTGLYQLDPLKMIAGLFLVYLCYSMIT